MAQAARRQRRVEEVPVDPAAIPRAYRRERARRRARVEHTREARRAERRFWIVLLGLLLASAIFALAVWEQIERLFGL